MKSMKIAAVVAGVFASATVYAQALVKIDGSSTVYPITEAVAEEFQKSKKNAIKVTVGISGTGGGFKKFCRGETDISDASRPIVKKEMDACAAAGIKYVELPVAFDALTVVVHPSNTWAANMKPEQLKVMWEPAAQGKITNWKQVDPSFPDLPLKLYGPGADSGTFEYFTEAIVGKAKSSRGDYTASEDDNVLVQGVSRDKGGIGYFGFAYYIENAGKLKAAAIWNGKKFVAPSAAVVEDGSYQPLARPIFIYVNAKSLEKPEVKEFVHFYMKHGAKLTQEVKYVQLPAKIYEINSGHVNKMKLGTVFGGVPEVGVKIDELVKREAK
ncbi:MAG: protein sphX [Rhodocyclales bacterium RIFCSPLOWO2_02_FULL_63_24]|nr:MAG: protein sphX [Rhodocyclales bacterium GWA2_65_19]OHC67927.1 MAG: protein sphX [Rhodocyclales bacterium RIFCSPLOWO2_02_FULL_63_24]